MKGDTEINLMILLFFAGAVFAAFAKDISLATKTGAESNCS
jgi:hypothetical protein